MNNIQINIDSKAIENFRGHVRFKILEYVFAPCIFIAIIIAHLISIVRCGFNDNLFGAFINIVFGIIPIYYFTKFINKTIKMFNIMMALKASGINVKISFNQQIQDESIDDF